MTHISCQMYGCNRQFLDTAMLRDHAEAVHTFDDIRQAVAEELREQFVGTDPDGDGDSIQWLYVVDIADDWVVFECDEGDGDFELYKVSYSIDDTGNVTFSGTPVEVTRRTVYDVVPDNEGPEGDDQQSGGQQFMLVPVGN